VGTNGIITTVAGNGMGGYSGDGGPASSAELSGPVGVAVDASGKLFIADTDNNVIRQVGTNGIITTVAGNGTAGYSGDGGAATNAELSGPFGAAVDASGKLFIADAYNNAIRQVGTNGIITTVAGDGTAGYSGDGGAAIDGELNYPFGVAVDSFGNLFIADTSNQRIRKVGTHGIIITVAGNGTNGYSDDGGAATQAQLKDPSGVAVDASGNLFIADQENNRIREVFFAGPRLVLTNVTGANAGSYDVVASSPYGSVTSSVVTLVVAIPRCAGRLLRSALGDQPHPASRLAARHHQRRGAERQLDFYSEHRPIRPRRVLYIQRVQRRTMIIDNSSNCHL
jgi:hypothetical protein